MPGHVEKIWMEYRQRVIPKHAPPIQLIETRRAFYSGSAALLSILMTQLEADQEPTEADLQMMDLIHQELRQFSQDVADGKK